MKVLITGRAASGKTAIAEELGKRGYNAYDTDAVPGLSNWEERASGRRVVLRDNSYVDLSKYRWMWQESVLKDLLGRHDSLFICGGAENDLDFSPLFDICFVLDIGPDTQAHRLLTRTDNDYGQDPAMLAPILEMQRQHLAAAKAGGANVLNTNRPLANVVDDLMKHLHDNG